MENYQELLLELCLKGQKNAYTPYSHFNVGAGLILKNGQTFFGANIENAAFGDTICAERSCLLATYSNGFRKNDILAFGIITDTDRVASPCGSCRQVMSELLDLDTPVYLFNRLGECEITSTRKLLPYSFNDEDLKNV